MLNAAMGEVSLSSGCGLAGLRGPVNGAWVVAGRNEKDKDEEYERSQLRLILLESGLQK